MKKKNVKRIVLLSILFIITIVVFIMYSFPVLYLSFELNEDGESYSVTGALPFKKNIDIPSYYRRLPVTKVGKNAFSYSSSLRTVTFKDDSQITIIGDSAFRNSVNLSKITIPDSVQNIGDYAFSGKRDRKAGMALTEIVIGENSQLTSIGKGAFEYCHKVTSISIPNGVTSIGTNAFRNCSSLTNISIPFRVASIGEEVFIGCRSLENIEVSEENVEYKSLGGVLFNKEQTELISYPVGNSRISYAIPESVLSIGSYSFSYSRNLKSITIPDSVLSIGSYSFYCCINLVSITIPNSVTSIGLCAFNRCSSLTSLIIPDSVISIGSSAFAHCDNLTSIFMMSTTPLDKVGSFFSYSTKGMKIYVPVESVATYKAQSSWGIYVDRIYSQSIIDEDGFAIENDILLQYVGKALQITIPDSVIGIGPYAFSGVTGEVLFGEASSITEIGDLAFSEYKGVSMTIPTYITSIGSSAFAQARSLTSLVIESKTPPSLGREVFDFTLSALKIYVPSESIDTYKGAIGWQDYSDKIFAME